MDLLQLLSNAALANAAPDATKSNSSSQQARHGGMLQQLAASVAAVQQQHPHLQQWQQQRQQQVAPVYLDQLVQRPQPKGTSQVGASSGNPFLQVQAALQQASQQLQGLLQQHGRQQHGDLPACVGAGQHRGQQRNSSNGSRDPSGSTSSTHLGMHTMAPPQLPPMVSAAGPSTAVLQHLLQLAVGQPHNAARFASHGADVGSSMATNNKQWEATGQQTVLLQAEPQQVQWQSAACEALQLFSLAELGQLPPRSLQQALLLQPQLLDQLLQAATAAVLQPVLQDSSHPEICSTTKQKQQQRQQDRNSNSNAQGVVANTGQHSSKSIEAALTAFCPWWQHLPAMLAASPVLLLRASHALLSWLGASGHHRLWLLLSNTCRPAWQQLISTAAPPPHGRAPLLKAAPTDAAAADAAVAATPAAGALALLCLAPWQQQLVQQLVQVPSPDGLLQLLRLLPGVHWPAQLLQHSARQPLAGAVAQTAGGVAAAAAAAGVAVAGMAVVAEGTVGGRGRVAATAALSSLQWPSQAEWKQALDYAGDSVHDSEPPAAAARAAIFAGQHMHITGALDIPCTKQPVGEQVLAAWRLAVQHRCWYQLACYLLVQSCLAGLQQQQQEQQQLPATAPLALQQQQQQQQQQGGGQPGLSPGQVAVCAAAFIAWVQHPLDMQRQCQLQQQLASAAASGSSGAASQQQQQQAIGAVSNSSSTLAALGILLRGWQAAPQRHHQQQLVQQAIPSAFTPSTTAAAASSSSSSSSSRASHAWKLAGLDLPLAAFQQAHLLLGCSVADLSQACWGTCWPCHTSPGTCSQHKQQEAHQHSRQGKGGKGTQGFGGGVRQQDCGGQGSGVIEVASLGPAAVCQLLDATNEMCAAALEVVQASLRAAQLAQQQQQGAGMQEAVGVLGGCSNWLAAQWIRDLDRDVEGTGSSSCGHHGAAMQYVPPQLDVAKRLLAAATACDQHVKAIAQPFFTF